MVTVQPGLNVLGASATSLFPAMEGPEIAEIRPVTGSWTQQCYFGSRPRVKHNKSHFQSLLPRRSVAQRVGCLS